MKYRKKLGEFTLNEFVSYCEGRNRECALPGDECPFASICTTGCMSIHFNKDALSNEEAEVFSKDGSKEGCQQ